MRQKRSGQAAFGGVMAGFALTVMLLGGTIPLATFCAPAIGGILVMLAGVECGPRPAWCMYAAVALLSVWLVPDIEMSMIFVCFLGYYPLLWPGLNRIRHPALRWGTKLLLFNGAVLLMYLVLLVVFPVGYLMAEMNGYSRAMVTALLALGNLAFCIYDAALCNVLRLYRVKLQPMLRRHG